MLMFARRAIQVANILNWLIGAVIAAFVLAMLFAADRIRGRLTAEGLIAENGYYWMVAAIALVLVMVPLAHAIFVRLRALILSADTDACFSEENARRLVTIAWCLIGVNLVDLAFGIFEARGATAEASTWFPSLTGWFAALLTFVLAGVFRRGAAMRADLEGTV